METLLALVYLLVSAPSILVQPVYQVRAQAADPLEHTEQICLILSGEDPATAVPLDCAAPDVTGIATFELPLMIPKWIVGYAAGPGGISGISNAACLRPIGDCNGDCAVNVSDMVCLNIKIFKEPK